MSESTSGRKASGRRKGESAAFLSKETVQEIDASRELPHNLDAEEGVIASILIDTTNEVINSCIAARMSENYFFKLSHKLMFAAFKAIFNEGRIIEPVILAEYLDKRGQLEQVGGAAEVARIYGRLETYTHYRQWMDIIREKYFTREIIRSCSEAIDMAFKNHGNVDILVNDIEEKVLRIGNDKAGDTVKKASEQVDSAITAINNLILNKGELTGVPTGFKRLDELMHGLHSNEMIVIAGRPGTGKTSIALNIAEHALFSKKPVPTLIFSLEMLATQLHTRMISSRARVDQHQLSRYGRIEEAKLKDIHATAREMKGAPLWIDDTAGLSILEVRAKARRLNQQLMPESKLGLIVIDYLQLMRGSDPNTPREQEIAEISRGIKAMAKELLVPVVVLAQLNRESEKGEMRDPRASDLRESGSIEQDADAILLLSRDRKHAKTENIDENQHWRVRVELAKNRNGPTGVATLLFNRTYTRYENFEMNDAQA